MSGVQTNRLIIADIKYLYIFLLFSIVYVVSAKGSDKNEPTKLSDLDPALGDGAAKESENRPANKLSELSLEQLMNIEVTSVSKRPEKLADTPAALYVITQDDIDRSGMKTIPDLLRMVPGVNVQQINAHSWGISARGFTQQFSNKLLVLVDGREVYSPTFGGVYWQQQDIPLDDIDRIEVIRGPGATLYGANAVNGVINITTKSAKETQGGLMTVDGGSALQEGSVRYGGKIGNDAWWRAYFKDAYYNESTAFTGDALDASDQARGGYRVDWEPTESNLVTIQADAYQGTEQELRTTSSLTMPFAQSFLNEDRTDGENVLGRWTHTNSSDSKTVLQLYYDRYRRRDFNFGETVQKIDLDVNHSFNWGENNQIIVGGGYRREMLDVNDSFDFSFIPRRDADNRYNAFIQDDATLIKDELHIIFGTKIEHNDLTGFEGEPSGRILWTPDQKNTVWASVSRAIRTPSFVERDLVFNASVFQPPFSPPVVAQFIGNPQIRAEDVITYEIGYRVEATKRLFFDTTAYYNVYDGSSTIQTLSPSFVTTPAPPHIVVPTTQVNEISGEIYGVEFVPTWQPFDWWKLSAAYSLYQAHLRTFVTGATADKTTDSYPQQMLNLRSYIDLPNNCDFDVEAYYVDKNFSNGPLAPIPQYIRLDARLGWRPRKDLEISIGIQNALDNKHPESTSILTPATEMPRSYYLSAKWKF